MDFNAENVVKIAQDFTKEATETTIAESRKTMILMKNQLISQTPVSNRNATHLKDTWVLDETRSASRYTATIFNEQGYRLHFVVFGSVNNTPKLDMPQIGEQGFNNLYNKLK